MEVNGNYIFTLKDAINLAEKAKQSPVNKQQYESAVLGNYIENAKHAEQDAARQESGAHLADGGKVTKIAGLPEGKTPNHVGFSNESPYAIAGLHEADGGNWSGKEGNWTYTPSQAQFDRDPHYADKLWNYHQDMKHGDPKYRSKIVLPNGEVWK